MVVQARVQQKGFASSEWRGANGQTRRMPAGQEAPSAGQIVLSVTRGSVTAYASRTAQHVVGCMGSACDRGLTCVQPRSNKTSSATKGSNVSVSPTTCVVAALPVGAPPRDVPLVFRPPSVAFRSAAGDRERFDARPVAADERDPDRDGPVAAVPGGGGDPAGRFFVWETATVALVAVKWDVTSFDAAAALLADPWASPRVF